MYNTHQSVGLVETPSLPINRVVESLQVSRLMTATPITVNPDTPLHHAQTLMQQHRLAYLPVVNNGQLVGVLTDRDVQTYSPSPATSLSKWELNYLLDKLTVHDVMTSDVVTVTPDSTVAEAIRLMLTHRLGALPVVEAQQLVGILSQADILQAFLEIPTTEPLAV